jgi:hypothetical protein
VRTLLGSEPDKSLKRTPLFVAWPPIGSVKMAYLSSVANKRPILRVAGGIILAFCCAAPVAWLVSNLVVDGLRALVH